ncbi:hypothetical protein BpHYR1_003502 [Brachionus plicatilis]|uniref:Uncharacterized protein n=1 Tax=Brachionus plicatilis TaxID=10195 RepID=A0A3M7RXY1_BRAPC|nr:hypothetical protein BpHYR1_003502 [Brachionus plicatilis]
MIVSSKRCSLKPLLKKSAISSSSQCKWLFESWEFSTKCMIAKFDCRLNGQKIHHYFVFFGISAAKVVDVRAFFSPSQIKLKIDVNFDAYCLVLSFFECGSSWNEFQIYYFFHFEFSEFSFKRSYQFNPQSIVLQVRPIDQIFLYNELNKKNRIFVYSCLLIK